MTSRDWRIWLEPHPMLNDILDWMLWPYSDSDIEHWGESYEKRKAKEGREAQTHKRQQGKN